MDADAVAIDYTSQGSQQRARVWPAVALVALFWAAHFATSMSNQPLFNRFMEMLASTGVLLIGFLHWWWLDKRGRRGERRAPVLTWLIAGIIVGVITITRSA